MSEKTIAENFESIKDKCLQRINEVGAGHGVTIATKILACIFNQFVRNVLVEDINDFHSIEGKPFLYLANHQTGIESLLVNGISLRKSQFTLSLAKKELKKSTNDVGILAKLYYAHGEKERKSSGLFFIDRESPVKILTSLKELMVRVYKENIACLVHIDGTRSSNSMDQAKSLNSVIIDEAIRLDIPMVPLRMTGGLPHEGDKKLDFPVNQGKQDYWIGKSIRSFQIKSMNLKERKDYILDKINGLGEESGPIIKNRLFKDLVESYKIKYGLSDYMAPIYMALESGKKDSQIKTLVEYISGRKEKFADDLSNKAWFQNFKDSFYCK